MGTWARVGTVARRKYMVSDDHCNQFERYNEGGVGINPSDTMNPKN